MNPQRKLPIQQNCGNCFFFHKNGESATQTIGYCRANPPMPHHEQDSEGGLIPKIGRFPVVLNSMWCGAWDLTDHALEENNKGEAA